MWRRYVLSQVIYGTNLRNLVAVPPLKGGEEEKGGNEQRKLPARQCEGCVLELVTIFREVYWRRD